MLRKSTLILAVFICLSVADQGFWVKHAVGSSSFSCGSKSLGLNLEINDDLYLDCVWIVSSGTRFNGNFHSIIFGPGGQIIINDVDNIKFLNTTFIDPAVREGKNLDPYLIEVKNSRDIEFRLNYFLRESRESLSYSSNNWNTRTHSARPFYSIKNQKRLNYTKAVRLAQASKAKRVVQPSSDERLFQYLKFAALKGVEPNLASGAANFFFKTTGAISGFRLIENKFEGRSEDKSGLMVDTSQKVSWVVYSNMIKNLISGVNVLRCSSCYVGKNIISDIKGYGLISSGSEINILDNTIWLAGYGVSGDGMTFGDVENINIFRNQITFAYCYGIWFTESAKNVNITNNLITAGVTTGINFQNTDGNPPDEAFQDISIVENVFLNNSAHALFMRNGKNVLIERNKFLSNRPFFIITPDEMKFNNIQLKNNLYSIEDRARTGQLPELIEDEYLNATTQR